MATCDCVAAGRSLWARAWAAASSEQQPCLWRTAITEL